MGGWEKERVAVKMLGASNCFGTRGDITLPSQGPVTAATLELAPCARTEGPSTCLRLQQYLH